MESKQKTIIVCVGNMLLLDEGFGPFMAKLLTDRETALQCVDEEHADILMGMFREDQTNPEEGDERIPVLDAGTMGMGLIRWIKEYDRLIILDIIDCKNEEIPPGSVFILTPEEMAENTVLHSLHDLKVIDVIGNSALAGIEAEFTCICVQAKDYDPPDFVIDLSDEVKAAIPNVLGALMQVLGE